MASFHSERRAERCQVVLAILAVLVVCACLLIVGAVEGHSLDPVTGCPYDQSLDAHGVCQ